MESHFDLTSELVGKITYHTNITDFDSDGKFKLMYMNGRSVRNKLGEIEFILGSQGFVVNVLVITETWFEQHSKGLYNIPNFIAFHACRAKKRGGGASVFVRSNVDAMELLSEEYENSSFLVVKLMESDFHIIAVYRPDDANVDNFLKKIESILVKYPKSIIVGDMNLNLLSSSNDLQKYKETINSNGFTFLNKIDIDFATRISTISSIIDHIITDILTFKYEIRLQDLSISDHKMIILGFDMFVPESTDIIFKTVLDYNKLKKESLFEHISDVENIDEFVHVMCNLIKKHTRKITVQNVKKSNNLPWMNEKIKKNIQIREKFFRCRKRNPTNTYICSMYQHYCREVKKEVKFAKTNYYGSIFEDSINAPKQLWKNLKKYVFNLGEGISREIKVKKNNVVVKNKKDVADIFNSFFVNIVSDSTPNALSTVASNIDFQNLNYEISYPFILKSVDEHEIFLTILGLKKNAATGYDLISTKFLQQFLLVFCPLLVKFINDIFQSGKFPDSLKNAIVTPIFKSGDKLDVANYRPISVLSSLSKIVEKIIVVRLERFLDDNDLISPRQFGFSKNSNTTAACLELTNRISKKLDEKRYVSCLFLDLKRAFDSVSHDILLKKFKKMQLDSVQMRLFSSYLSGRTQVVSIEGELSDPLEIKVGVPQGSILGPTLFRIFINDLTQIKLEGYIILYADDAVLIYDESDVTKLYDYMHRDLVNIKFWLELNSLTLNVKKTKYLIFQNKTSMDLDHRFLKYDNDLVERVDEFVYLGLVIDCKFKWNLHVDKIKKSITPYIFAIRRAKNILPKNILMLIYNAYILSHFVYLNPIWSSCSVQKLNELYVLQKRAIKFILNVPVLFPSILLFNDETKFISIHALCKRELLILIHKIVHNKIANNIDLTKIGAVHNYETRRTSQYRIDMFATNARIHNIVYRGLNEFNKLPRILRHEISLQKFRKSIMSID